MRQLGNSGVRVLATGCWEKLIHCRMQLMAGSHTGDVTISSDSTAVVVTTKYGVLFSPSGRKALPYWKKRMDHRSFFQASQGCQSRPSRPPKMRTKRSAFFGLGSTMVEKKMSRPTRHPWESDELVAGSELRQLSLTIQSLAIEMIRLHSLPAACRTRSKDRVSAGTRATARACWWPCKNDIDLAEVVRSARQCGIRRRNRLSAATRHFPHGSCTMLCTWRIARFGEGIERHATSRLRQPRSIRELRRGRRCSKYLPRTFPPGIAVMCRPAASSHFVSYVKLALVCAKRDDRSRTRPPWLLTAARRARENRRGPGASLASSGRPATPVRGWNDATASHGWPSEGIRLGELS